MERILIFIKHRLPVVWSFIEEINGLIFSLIYKRRLDKTLGPVFLEYAQTPFFYRILHRDDAMALYNLITNQDPADLQYFNPHSFDITAIKKQLKKRSFLMMGAFDGDQLIGYFFLRFFINKKSFVGRLIDNGYRGNGIGKIMNNIMYNTSWRMGFRCLSTISKSNKMVIRSHSKNHSMRVLKELKNNYLLVEFIPGNIVEIISDR